MCQIFVSITDFKSQLQTKKTCFIILCNIEQCIIFVKKDCIHFYAVGLK